MKKLLILLPILALLACSPSASQKDFYGTWVWEEGSAKMEHEITSTIFNTTWTPELVSHITPIQKTTFEIFSWEAIKNDNAETKDQYPTGYLLGLRHGLGNTSMRLFMHNNKHSYIYNYEFEGNPQHYETYIKPVPKEDFFGTWINEEEPDFRMIIDNKNISLWNNDDNTITESIFLWKAIVNNDYKTNNEYPVGYLIKYSEVSTWEESYYLHKSRDSILYIDNGLFNEPLIYNKLK